MGGTSDAESEPMEWLLRTGQQPVTVVEQSGLVDLLGIAVLRRLAVIQKLIHLTRSSIPGIEGQGKIPTILLEQMAKVLKGKGDIRFRKV